MRTIVLFALILIAPLIACSQEASDSNSALTGIGHRMNLEWSSDLAVSNNVVWRGFLSNRSTTVQPTVTVKAGPLSFASTSYLEFDGLYCWKEHDLQANYSKSLTKRLSLSSGYINYAFPALNKDRFAHEFFAGISVAGRTGVRFQTFQNVGLSSGTYVSAELSRSFRPSSRLPIDTVASIGYNRKLFIPVATFSDAVLTISTTVPVGGTLTLTPQIGYSKGLNGRYFDHHVTAGLRFTYVRKRSISSK